MLKLFDKSKQWEEVEEYRALLEPPDRFDNGFTLRTILGVLFISLIMTPGEMYLGLVTGGSLGSAAQWVTVILFLEVAKRSFTSLKRQEIYLLVYVAGALVVREEGAFLDLLWRQYFVRSDEAEMFGLSRLLPFWWVPPPDSRRLHSAPSGTSTGSGPSSSSLPAPSSAASPGLPPATSSSGRCRTASACLFRRRRCRLCPPWPSPKRAVTRSRPGSGPSSALVGRLASFSGQSMSAYRQ